MPLGLFKSSFFAYLLVVLCQCSGQAARASDADTIGATALRQADPTLTGAGIAIILAEAPLSGGTSAATDSFEVNPSSIGLPPNSLTYINYAGSVAKTFTNSIGLESTHADSVAADLISIAPGVGSIDNYDANYYINRIVASGRVPSSFNATLHNAQIVNQSFVFLNPTAADIASIDKSYDSYAAKNNVLFISGAGNGVSPPLPPSTCYNGISVNAISMSPVTSGPTSDGRSKPDLTAPGNETSYSTAEVSGAAAILLQAASRGDGGTGTATNASDIRTMKALLLNGASKPSGWTHTDKAPLDPQYGAGLVNVDQSWLGLTAGNQKASASAPSNQLLSSENLRSSSGWDLGSLPDGNTTNHYFFTAPATGAGSDTLTATIAWNVSHWDSSNNAIFNKLSLALFDTSNPLSLISISDSTFDNVQQLDVTGLVPGDTYDLRVFDSAATVNGGAETYGLAYSMRPVLTAVPEPSSIVLLVAAGVSAFAFARRTMKVRCR